MNYSLGSAGISRRHALTVALGTNAGQDARSLDTFGEATKHAQIVLIGALDHLNIDHGLHPVVKNGIALNELTTFV